MTYTIISFHKHYIPAAAHLYQRVFGVRHIEDQTPQSISESVIEKQAQRESFIGVLAIAENQEVIGMAWGYDTPTHNERIIEIVQKKMGQAWVEHTFVVEVFAVLPEQTSPELIADVHEGLEKRVAEEGYKRMRVRLERARLDNIPQRLQNAHGWVELQALPHVIWYGKEIDR